MKNNSEIMYPSVNKLYQDVLALLKHFGFEMTMAESTVLREEAKKMSEYLKEKETKEEWVYFNVEKEIMTRFFWHYYGINLEEYSNLIKTEYKKDALKDLLKYVQEKIRKDTELI